MEPSLSLDPNIVLRTAQGESRYGARVKIDPGTGAMQSDHSEGAPPPDVEAPPHISLRAVSGRWLLDAAPESRVSINGVAIDRKSVV